MDALNPAHQAGPFESSAISDQSGEVPESAIEVVRDIPIADGSANDKAAEGDAGAKPDDDADDDVKNGAQDGPEDDADDLDDDIEDDDFDDDDDEWEDDDDDEDGDEEEGGDEVSPGEEDDDDWDDEPPLEARFRTFSREEREERIRKQGPSTDASARRPAKYHPPRGGVRRDASPARDDEPPD